MLKQELAAYSISENGEPPIRRRRLSEFDSGFNFGDRRELHDLQSPQDQFSIPSSSATNKTTRLLSGQGNLRKLKGA